MKAKLKYFLNYNRVIRLQNYKLSNHKLSLKVHSFMILPSLIINKWHLKTKYHKIFTILGITALNKLLIHSPKQPIPSHKHSTTPQTLIILSSQILKPSNNNKFNIPTTKLKCSINKKLNIMTLTNIKMKIKTSRE